MRLRRRDELTYTIPTVAPRPLGQQFINLAEQIGWGTSVDFWRRRCEASLRASRRRRGKVA